MAIHKPVTDASGNLVTDANGNVVTLPVPDFSFTDNEGLARVIVDAWVDQSYQDLLLQRGTDHITVTPAAAAAATESVRECGFQLKRAVVISEAEYYRPYTVQDPDEIVFVLPNPSRVKSARPGQSLLDTARLLMATTPNGI
jgi:hypothetical protein